MLANLIFNFCSHWPLSVFYNKILSSTPQTFGFRYHIDKFLVA